MVIRAVPCLALLLAACAPANNVVDTHFAEAKRNNSSPHGCQIFNGPTHSSGQSVAPMGYIPPSKTDSGYWDQNTAGACYLVSLVNGNIDAGGDDDGEQLMIDVMVNVIDQGIAIEDLYDGADSAEQAAIQDAKVDAMGDQGIDVSFETIHIDEDGDVADAVEDRHCTGPPGRWCSFDVGGQ